MFKKILLESNGDGSTRLVRACRELGIQSVVAFNACDSASLSVRLADECVRLETPVVEQVGSEILDIARLTAADAIYLDNRPQPVCPDFIRACQQAGISLIGSSVELAETVGCKEEARKIVRKAGFPVIDEYTIPIRQIGVFLLGGPQGHLIRLGERQIIYKQDDQVLLEESPAPCLMPQQRRIIHKAAIKIGKTLGLQSIGMVEFFLGAEGQFYFSEIKSIAPHNYPLVELTLGIDLVETQIRIAQGDPLTPERRLRRLKGWAMMSRVASEQDGKPGAIITAWGENRVVCLRRMRQALDEYKPESHGADLSRLRSILDIPEVLDGTYSAGTSFIRTIKDEGCAERLRDLAIAAAVLYAWRCREIKPIHAERLSSKWVRNSRKMRAWEYGGLNYEQVDRDG